MREGVRTDVGVASLSPRPGPPATRGGTLHALFEERADLSPAAVAVEDGDAAATYGEIEARANRIARHLRRRRVGRGSLVGLLLPRSADAYAALLGILKAGAAYVPLDPACPPERIRYVLGDCGAAALVTAGGLAESLAGFEGAVVLTDAHRAVIGAERPERLPPGGEDAGPRDLCYVIYTSGSTGVPKGVMIEHRSAEHLVREEGRLFGVGHRDRVYQGFSLAFDASVEEVWLAFHAGAVLVAATPEMERAGPDLPRMLAERGVTVLSCVPTLLAMMEEDAPTVRLLILGGEACPEGLPARWARPGRRLVNTYGPTEATVIATCADLEPGRPVTIGRAIPGYRVRLLDGSLRPVPPGGTGEIAIGGVGVARGYVGLPDRTRERFVRDPGVPPGGPGGRLYLTGDLGRLDGDGNLLFLGRADSQVKVRGFRVELEEIESALLRGEGVRAAACALREDPARGPALVAYVVPSNGTPVDGAALRALVSRRLPAYMVPERIVTVRDLPRLPSGKLDRAALPAPGPVESPGPRGDGPALTDTEGRVAAVWAGLFATRPVGPDDDFFRDLGGHSLLAARAVSSLRKHPPFASVSMVAIYEHPTIRSLAAALDAEAPATEREPAEGPVPREGPGEEVLRRREVSRHRRCGLVQGAALYFVYAFRALQWVTPYLVFFALSGEEVPVLAALAWAGAAALAVLPALLLLAVAAKWALLGRIRPGVHRLWGGYYRRFWFVQALVSALHLDHLAGTPLLPWVFRLFGSRIGRDVHLATDDIAAFDLVSIGDGSTVDEEVGIMGCAVEGGTLVVGPVTVGRGCFVGTSSVLREGAVLEDGARLEDLSLLPAGGRVPAGETWAGSPARPAEGPLPEAATATPQAPRGRLRRAALAVLYAALCLALPLVILAAFVPGIALLARVDLLEEPLLYLAMAPVVGAAFVLVLGAEVALVKWLLLGRVREGTHPLHGPFYVRYWIVERLLQASLDMAGPLRATLYMAPWYRALGARLGRFVELSTATSAVPDLLEIDDGGTVADEVSLGAPHVERGWLRLAPTRIGRRAFLGNSAVVPGGTALGDGSLVGVLSVPPRHPADAARPGATWLGSPALALPRREPSEGFVEARTYEPPRRLVTMRAAFEVLRVTLPPAGFVLVTAAVLSGVFALREILGLVPALLLLPVVYAACCAGVLAAVALAKWVLMGRYRPFRRPLWSFFVWRLELSNALYEFLASPLVLDALLGTPFLPWCFRLLGARVGRRVYAETTGLIEFDLVEIGDGAALNDACVLQTHLFEDRVLKASRLRIGRGCVVGGCSVVLYDATLEDGARLDALSLLMKGESLPAGTSWAGNPARRRGDPRRRP